MMIVRSNAHQPKNHGASVRPRSGFTLLELLVAVAMVAIIAAALFSSLGIVFKAKASIEQATEPYMKMGAAMNFLKKDLESALPPTSAPASGGYVLQGPFIGQDLSSSWGQDGDDLVFCAAVDAPSRVTMQTDIRQIEYTVQEDNGEHLLVRLVTTNLLADVQPTPEREIIMRGVRSFNLRYYDGTQWQDSWDSTAYTGDSTSLVTGTLTSNSNSLTGGALTAAASTTGDTSTVSAMPFAVEVTIVLDPPLDRPNAEPQTISRWILLPCAGQIPAAGDVGDTTGAG
jgi:general secretion pathway protein J